MDARELRGWLLCQPRPVSLRIVSADQQAHTLEITPGMSWIQAAESCAALQPDLVEALDPKGNLIRAIRPNDAESEEEDTSNLSLAQDPENARLITFAKLLSDAYKHSTEVAFDRLASLFDAVNRRSESLEKSLVAMERIQRKAVEEAMEAGAADPNGAGTFEQTMLAAFLQGQQNKAAAAAAAVSNGATNGVKKETPK